MSRKLTPEDLQNENEFTLLEEVSHFHLKEFIVEQIQNEKHLIKAYSVYQISMIVILFVTVIKAFMLSSHGLRLPLYNVGYAILFSFTALIFIHEFIHAVAYWLTGSRNLKFGVLWKKFLFYVLADKQVISPGAFRFVANAPFVFVKVITLFFTIYCWHSPAAYFFLTIMCIHSLFCAGDMAMLAFYRQHPDKEIYNYDDPERHVTFFYFRKKN